MVEYIKRNAAIDACFNGWNNNAHDCAENIRKLPAADVSPIKHAKWIDKSSKKLLFGRVLRDRIVQCDQCRNYLDMDGVNGGRGDANYCPNCGARMEVCEEET